ncbi:E3 ubiquitin-protein ligase RNF34 isoform X2 [Anticarsia gemmatalis]|uniref:E3 ubiquitin-protein ligase RNF34 isoform X2 n=1 Tax=Anticarsia gemmatalis TaxID=129554 RepID=UPI003F75AC16
MAAGWCGRIGGREGSKMPCESCAVQFSVFKRKRACCECERYYCSGCLRRGGGTMCAPCRVLSTRPLSRATIAHLKVRDLQCFLQRQNVSTRGCVEKEELVSLCVSHVNSSSYRRRGQRAGASPFSSLKGFTNNINDLFNSAFNPAPNNPQPPPARGFTSGCFNAAHAHAPSPPVQHDVLPTTTPPRPNPERFTTRPGGEADIRVPVPDSSGSVSRSTSGDTPRVDTADCFEIEDLDDAGWEFVNRPADPLPDDSAEILMTVTLEGGRRTLNVSVPGALVRGVRAHSSDLQLDALDPRADRDSASLRDEPQDHAPSPPTTPPPPHTPPTMRSTMSPAHISVERFKQESELDELSVKQLKELLTRSRVEYRGCLERADLLERAKTLWRNHQIYKDDIDNLPIEECCKICMAAPLECVLLECGHIAACTGCAKQLAECPICRQYVVRAVRFFRS